MDTPLLKKLESSSLSKEDIHAIRQHLRATRKSAVEMTYEELKEYLLAVPDDEEVKLEYVRRATELLKTNQ